MKLKLDKKQVEALGRGEKVILRMLLDNRPQDLVLLLRAEYEEVLSEGELHAVASQVSDDIDSAEPIG